MNSTVIQFCRCGRGSLNKLPSVVVPNTRSTIAVQISKRCYTWSKPSRQLLEQTRCLPATYSPQDNSLSLQISANGNTCCTTTIGRSYTNNAGSSGWSLGKKLLMVWSAGALAIGVVVAVQLRINATALDEKERIARLERVKDKESPFQLVASIPCMRNSLLVAIIGAFSSWVVTFLFTSSFRKAYTMLGVSPFLIGTSFFVYCTLTTKTDRDDTEKLSEVLQDMQKKKAMKPPAGETDNEQKSDNK